MRGKGDFLRLPGTSKETQLIVEQEFNSTGILNQEKETMDVS